MKKDFFLLFKVAVDEVAALAGCDWSEARKGVKQAYLIRLGEVEKANRKKRAKGKKK